MSPSPRRPRLPKELFETRSHAWHSLGLGDELAPRFSKRQFGGLLLALLVIAGTLVVYGHRQEIAPGYGRWIRAGTVVILVVVGSVAVHWLVRGLSPRLYRPLDPAPPRASTAGSTRPPPGPPASSSACWRSARWLSSRCGSPASTPAPSLSAAP